MPVGRRLPAPIRSAARWLLLAASAIWCVAILVTAIQVQRVRSDLSRLAADVAHHNAAHHPRSDARSSRYLDLSVRARAGRTIRAASIRLVRIGSALFVEVRIEAAVGFALGGHPTIGITVVRSVPVE